MSDEKIAGAPAPQAAPPEPPAPQPAATQQAAPAPPPPTQPATPPLATTPAPVQLDLVEAQPTPEPPPPPQATAGEGLGDLRAELAAELERTKSAREAVEAISTRAEQRSRVDYLRQMGASASLSDEHLLTLAPAADPTTSDGAQSLQAWRDANGALFEVPTQGATQTAQISERLKSSAHGTFGVDFHRAQMRATFGGE